MSVNISTLHRLKTFLDQHSYPLTPFLSFFIVLQSRFSSVFLTVRGWMESSEDRTVLRSTNTPYHALPRLVLVDDVYNEYAPTITAGLFFKCMAQEAAPEQIHCSNKSEKIRSVSLLPEGHRPNNMPGGFSTSWTSWSACAEDKR